MAAFGWSSAGCEHGTNAWRWRWLLSRSLERNAEERTRVHSGCPTDKTPALMRCGRARRRSIAAAAIALTVVVVLAQGCSRVRAGVGRSICDDRGLVRWADEYAASFLYNASFVEGSIRSEKFAASDGAASFSLGRTDVPQGNSFKSCNKVEFQKHGGRREDLNRTLESALLGGLLEKPSSHHFLFFLGYGHSGHSIVGAILDAHPEMIIANELHALKLYYCMLTRKKQMVVPDEIGRSDRIYAGPSEIKSSLSSLFQPQTPVDFAMLVDFYAILNTAVCSQIGRVQHHDYSIPGQYQGSWKSIDAVKYFGDKKGGLTSDFLEELACSSCSLKGDALISEMEYYKKSEIRRKTLNSEGLIYQVFDRSSEPTEYRQVVRYDNEFHDLSKFSVLKTYLSGSCFLSCSRTRAEVEEFLSEFASRYKPPLYVIHVLPHFRQFLKNFFSRNQKWRTRFVLNMELVRMMHRMPEKYRVLEMPSTSLRYNSTHVILKLCKFLSIDCAADFVEAASNIVFPLGSNTLSEELPGRNPRTLSETDAIAFHELLTMYPELKAMFSDDIAYQKMRHSKTRQDRLSAL